MQVNIKLADFWMEFGTEQDDTCKPTVTYIVSCNIP